MKFLSISFALSTFLLNLNFAIAIPRSTFRCKDNKTEISMGTGWIAIVQWEKGKNQSENQKRCQDATPVISRIYTENSGNLYFRTGYDDLQNPVICLTGTKDGKCNGNHIFITSKLRRGEESLFNKKLNELLDPLRINRKPITLSGNRHIFVINGELTVDLIGIAQEKYESKNDKV